MLLGRRRTRESTQEDLVRRDLTRGDCPEVKMPSAYHDAAQRGAVMSQRTLDPFDLTNVGHMADLFP